MALPESHWDGTDNNLMNGWTVINSARRNGKKNETKKSRRMVKDLTVKKFGEVIAPKYNSLVIRGVSFK